MALEYLDASALVKRYVPEVGSAWVARLCHQEAVAISLVAIPELASALARRAREGTLSTQQRDTLFQAFLRDTRTFTLIEPNQAIAQKSAALLLTAPLNVRFRTLDALQVASALLAFARPAAWRGHWKLYRSRPGAAGGCKLGGAASAQS